MDRAAISNVLIDVVDNQTGIRVESLNESAMLLQELGMDSIDLVGMIVEVENRFGIRIATEELRQLTTVGSLIDLLQSKLPAARLAA